MTFGKFWEILGNFENTILDLNKYDNIFITLCIREYKEYNKFGY